MTNNIITQDFINRSFIYNKELGIISRIKGKKKLGTMSNGYIRIYINRKPYMVHKIIWLIEHGYIPKNIDHINHNRSDNRIENLREVSHKENCRNQTIRNTSTSNINGVHWYKQTNKWQVHITVNGKRIHLGYFDDIEIAKNARNEADIKYGFHPNHGN